MAVPLVTSTAEATLRLVFSELVENLRADDVIDHLYQSYILSKEDYESIRNECWRAASKEDFRTVNRRLLMVIGNRPPASVTRLVEILEKNQKALADVLAKGEWHCVPVGCSMNEVAL